MKRFSLYKKHLWPVNVYPKPPCTHQHEARRDYFIFIFGQLLLSENHKMSRGLSAKQSKVGIEDKIGYVVGERICMVKGGGAGWGVWGRGRGV